MDRVALIETVALYWPIVMLIILAKKVERSFWVGALLAFMWQIAMLPWLNYLGQYLGWWNFGGSGIAVLGMPVSIYLGWSLLWGGVAVMALHWMRVWPVVLVMLILDLLVMPLMQPSVSLGRFWLVGEFVLIALGLIPGLFVAKWSVGKRYVGGRSFLICVSFAVALLTVLPVMGDGLDSLWGRWQSMGLWKYTCAMIVFFLGLPALAGASEFVRVGRGTPIPYDPPQKLVSSGVYAYIANPMQISITLVLLFLGWVFSSYTLAGLGTISVIYCCGIARWSEESDLAKRFGVAWKNYRGEVQNWKLRAFPVQPSSKAQLYFDEDCVACSSIARWFYSRRPRGLELKKASDYKGRLLERVTYKYGDYEVEVDGVNAIASALQHIHLGWAMVGWCIQLPVVLPLIQLCVDLSGGRKKEH